MKNRWFKFFPSDFLTGIRNLNPIEVTAYIVVLCELYDHEGDCRRDDAHMSRVCRIRLGDFTRALDSLIAKGKIDIASGMLSNKRVTEEIQKRLLAALDKARQRRESDVTATRTQHEQPRKGNKNNGANKNVLPYREVRTKDNSSSDLYALPPREPLSAEERRAMALEGYRARERKRSSSRSH